jgi:hypothetical protein
MFGGGRGLVEQVTERRNDRGHVASFSVECVFRVTVVRDLTVK